MRVAMGAMLGALPGCLVMVTWNHRSGIVVAAFGAIAGALLALPGVSIGRTFRLLLAMIVARNVPVSDRIYDWVDGSEPQEDQAPPFSEAFGSWLLALEVKHRRGWLVLAALIIGLIAGAVLAVHDVNAHQAAQPGYVLPFEHSKDSIVVQGVMLSAAVAIWTAAAVALLAAPAYRRPVLLAIAIFGTIGFGVGYAASDGRGPGPLTLAVFLSTFTSGAAMFLAALISMEEGDEKNEQRGEHDYDLDQREDRNQR